jgi:hypothetical protein
MVEMADAAHHPHGAGANAATLHAVNVDALSAPRWTPARGTRGAGADSYLLRSVHRMTPKPPVAPATSSSTAPRPGRPYLSMHRTPAPYAASV